MTSGPCNILFKIGENRFYLDDLGLMLVSERQVEKNNSKLLELPALYGAVWIRHTSALTSDPSISPSLHKILEDIRRLARLEVTAGETITVAVVAVADRKIDLHSYTYVPRPH